VDDSVEAVDPSLVDDTGIRAPPDLTGAGRSPLQTNNSVTVLNQVSAYC
jgi:hypothetical protein